MRAPSTPFPRTHFLALALALALSVVLAMALPAALATNLTLFLFVLLSPPPHADLPAEFWSKVSTTLLFVAHATPNRSPIGAALAIAPCHPHLLCIARIGSLAPKAFSDSLTPSLPPPLNWNGCPARMHTLDLLYSTPNA